MLGLTIFLIFFMIFIYMMRNYRYWERKGVKQKFVLPIFGDNLDPLIKRYAYCDFVMKIYNRFPTTRYSGFYQYNVPILMLRDPELIKQMCVKDSEHFLDHWQFFPDDADPLWNKNLFALKGQNWKNMRATLTPSFTGSKMRQMFVLMHECAENFTNFFLEKSQDFIEVELKDVFTRYTNDVIASTAFGIKCDSLNDRDNEFYIKGRQATDFTGLWKNIQFVFMVIAPWIGRLLGASIFDKEVSDFFRKVMKETLEYRKKNNIQRGDMIDLLINARNEKLKESQQKKLDLSHDDITSQALLFFFGGFEPVSNAMCFMAYELAKNPEIQVKLIEELDDFRRNNRKITHDDLVKLPYLDMVFHETLRKWPSSLITDRVCVKPYTIQPENSDEKPVNLSRMESIWVPIWALHHDPDYWKNPDDFDPERFSPENKEKIVPYTYLPFGVGPRNCIGSRFAVMEVKAIFCVLLEYFEIVPTKKSPIPFIPHKRSFNVASENGFWFAFKKRSNPNQ